METRKPPREAKLDRLDSLRGPSLTVEGVSNEMFGPLSNVMIFINTKEEICHLSFIKFSITAKGLINAGLILSHKDTGRNRSFNPIFPTKLGFVRILLRIIFLWLIILLKI